MAKINKPTTRYGSADVTVWQHSSDRYNIIAKIVTSSNLAIVPIEICAIAAGKDKWMRDILFKCPDCGQEIKACESEGSNICATCYEKAFDEHSD